METRKVQLSGGTTYTVSLPKSWAKEQGIDAGSSLSLYPNSDGSLLVEPGGDRATETQSTSVDISTDAGSVIRQRIHALHAVGYDTVTLVDKSGHSEDHRKVVEDTVATLSGFELLKANNTRIRLQNLIDAENVDIRKSVLRLRLVTLGMHRDAITAVLTDDETLAQRVIDRDNEADKLLAMVTRYFRRALTNLQEVEKLEYSRDELFEYYYVSRQLERIADHAEKIARFAHDPEVTVPADFEGQVDTLASASRTVVDTAADVILADAGIEGAQSALARRDELTRDLRDFDRELYTHDDPAEAYAVGLMLDSIRRTGEYGANIARIGIQQVARESECLD